MTCICKDDGFRNSTITCAKNNCAQDGTPESAYESALNTVFDRCANGEFSVPTGSTEDSIKTTKTTSRHRPTSTTTTRDDSGPSTGLIAGVAIGGVVLVALFGILIWWLVKRSKRRVALENRPVAFYPTSGPVAPMTEDNKLYLGQPLTHKNQFDQFGAGAMGAASFAATTGTSGQQRPQYPAPASSSGSSSSGTQLLTTATPPSQSGSSGSRPGTSGAGAGGLNPYLVGRQRQQQAPLQLGQAHYDPYAAAGGSADKWPADVKRPLTVLSADETPQHQQQGDLPPPMYTGQ